MQKVLDWHRYSDEYTDDDDDSWKVRRAAAHCLSAIFVNNPDQITALYPKVKTLLLNTIPDGANGHIFCAFHWIPG